MQADGLSWSQGAETDDKGRFSLPLRSADAPVTLQVKVDSHLLLETSILPSSDAIRLVVPGGIPPKK
jgi:hypothetical protein